MFERRTVTSVPTVLVEMVGREPLPTLVSLIAMSDRFNDVVYDCCVTEICKRLPGIKLLSEAELILTVIEDAKSTEYFSEARVQSMKNEAVARAGVAQATGMSSTAHTDNKLNKADSSVTGGSSASGINNTSTLNTPMSSTTASTSTCRKVETTPDSHRIGALETAMSTMSQSISSLTSTLLNSDAAQQQNRLLQQLLVNNLGVSASAVAQHTSINESALLQSLLQQRSNAVSPASSTNPHNVVLPQLTADQLVGGLGGAPALATTTVHAAQALQQQQLLQQQPQLPGTGSPSSSGQGGFQTAHSGTSAVTATGNANGNVVEVGTQGAPAPVGSPANSDSSMVVIPDPNGVQAPGGSTG